MPGKLARVRWKRRRVWLYVALSLSTLFALWPAIIMFLEGLDIDLSPIFAGKSVRIVGGVPHYSGGIFPTIIHYTDALGLGNFPRLVLNSSAIAFLSIAIGVAASLPAAYALNRLKIKGGNAISYALLALRTVSPFVVILPLYLLFVRDGLWDTYPGVAFAYLAVVLPISVWLLRGFFADIPSEIYEAATVFGASEVQVLRRIALPLLIPGLIATVIFLFSLLWNEFLFAEILTGPVTKTVSVGVWAGTGQASGFRSLAWDELNAAGTLAFIPAITLLLLIRKYLASGFSLATAR